jgi:hypothetical protein
MNKLTQCVYKGIDCCFQWGEFIAKNPIYLTGINIKIMVSNDVTHAFYLFPRYRGVRREQLSACYLV